MLQECRKRDPYEQEEFILKQYEETHRIMFHEYAEDDERSSAPVDDDCEELSTGKSRIC